ncbi:MAG: carbon-nitrogen hydrolase family protein [Thermomicrobiales bacterium]|jgi:predicted amidohydrolase|nr:carbon-nitrogen hydrolase family protein [Thermomicrobiales bacterium]
MTDFTGIGPRFLNVGVAQLNARDDKAANINVALDLIDRAAAGGARLVVLPEIWPYFGADSGNRDHAEPIPGPLTEILAERAIANSIYLHAGTWHETRPGDPRLYNTAVVFSPTGEIIGKYSKIHMFDVEIEGVASYRESATIAPGDAIVNIDIDGINVGLAICYDLRFPELFRILALNGAEAIVLPAAFTMATGRDHWEVLIRARAIENGVFMIASGQWGPGYDGKWCYGRSMIVDPWGTPLAIAPDQTTVIHATLDREHLGKVRRQVPSLANRMPDRYVWPEAGVGIR